MQRIYHITSQEQWTEACEKGFYEAPSLHTEGFIHCSAENQVEGVLKRYYAGKDHLVKLIIETDKLEHPLKWELAPSVQETFPHVYGPINMEAIVDVDMV